MASFLMSTNVSQQKLNQPAQPCFDVHGLQDRLAFRCARQHRTRNQVGGLFRVGDGIEVADDFLGGKLRRLFTRAGEGQSQLEPFPDQFAHFGQQRIGRHTVARRCRQRAYALDAIRLVAHGFLEFHARQALQDQVRGAVLVPDGNANQPHPGHGQRRLTRTAGPPHGDREHAIGVERVGQHLTIARLENVKRQQRLREERRIRQSHHGHFAGQLHIDNLRDLTGGARPDPSARDARLPNAPWAAMLKCIMKNLIGVVILAVVCIGLVVALVATKKTATQEKRKDTETILFHSNQWEKTRADLEEHKQVIQSLEKDLETRKQQFGELTNKYAEVATKYTETTATLAKTEQSLKNTQD